MTATPDDAVTRAALTELPEQQRQRAFHLDTPADLQAARFGDHPARIEQMSSLLRSIRDSLRARK